MISTLKLVQFRWFENITLDFDPHNLIIWNNGSGKTNVLLAIKTLFWERYKNLKKEDIIQSWKSETYIEALYHSNWEIFECGYFLENKKWGRQKITLNKKSMSKKALFDFLPKCVFFSPLDLHLFYLWPQPRRDFLDQILLSSHFEYQEILQQYDLIVKQRNKVLKSIYEGNSQKSEITFWDDSFINIAQQIYTYRFTLNDFIQDFFLKNTLFTEILPNFTYHYITKASKKDTKTTLRNYLQSNFERDIILKSTSIWPHRDDFDIIFWEKHISWFASRWEIKSIIFLLKKIESFYIQSHTHKTPLFLIDDLESELDQEHTHKILEMIGSSQVMVTNITDISTFQWKKIYLK